MCLILLRPFFLQEKPVKFTISYVHLNPFLKRHYGIADYLQMRQDDFKDLLVTWGLSRDFQLNSTCTNLTMDVVNEALFNASAIRHEGSTH